MDIREYWKLRQEDIEKALQAAIPAKDEKPATIHEAMHYSLMAGGKRLRPVLCLAAAETFGGTVETAMPLACAVECIHTYSLIHDDLPCMDDDDLRRGMPTSHKVYGEGIAVLAGDALLTEAFAIAARVPGWPRYSTADVICELAFVSGSRALIAGQVVDLECEGRKISLEQLRYIHECKTAALITGALRLGAMSANVDEAGLDLITRFGRTLGLAFQVVDDVLDITQTSEQLGKSAGKDLEAEKATYPALLGLEGAREKADRLTREAKEILQPLGEGGAILAGIVAMMLDRKN